MNQPDVWWMSLDTNYVRFREVKARKVVAQGWPQLGDLSDLVGLAVNVKSREEFEAAIRSRAAEVYGPNSVELERAPGSLWRLFSIRRGDLVVATEGTAVLGIARLAVSGWESYQYDAKFPYAQAVGHPIDWIDWNFVKMGPAPNGPRRLLGIKAIRSERERVLEAWARFNEARP